MRSAKKLILGIYTGLFDHVIFTRQVLHGKTEGDCLLIQRIGFIRRVGFPCIFVGFRADPMLCSCERKKVPQGRAVNEERSFDFVFDSGIQTVVNQRQGNLLIAGTRGSDRAAGQGADLSKTQRTACLKDGSQQ